MERMYHSIPNTKLPAYHSSKVNPPKLNIANDHVDIGDDHIDDNDDDDENLFDRGDDYMQVEEPEEELKKEENHLEYYLDNFGGKDNPIIF